MHGTWGWCMFNTYLFYVHIHFPRPHWDNIFSFKFYPAEFSGFNYLLLCVSWRFLYSIHSFSFSFFCSFVRFLCVLGVHCITCEKAKVFFVFFCMANLYEIELKIKWLCACVSCIVSWWYKTISSLRVFSSVVDMRRVF